MKTTNHSNEMKEKIRLAMKACEDNSPCPTANMMKFDDGFMITYGGTMCVRVPCGIEADCAFNPRSLFEFYRKPRTSVTYTAKDDRLIVRSGREQVTLRSLPGEKMPVIRVLGAGHKTKKFPKMKALKSLIDCVDPRDSRSALQGIIFQDGLAVGTDGKVILALPSGLPGSMLFILPLESAKFISTIKDNPVNEVACDGTYVEFRFKDGMILTSPTIKAESVPNIKKILNTTDDHETVKLHPDTWSEIADLKCDNISISHSGVSYQLDDDTSFGEIELKTKGRFAFAINRKMFALMLELNLDDKIFVDGRSVHANGGKFFRMVISQRRK